MSNGNTISQRDLLTAIAATDDCSVAQLVVRSGRSGFAIETTCERLEERGLITGSGPMVRRRYRLTEAGRDYLEQGAHRAIASDAMTEDDFRRYLHPQTQAARALAWGQIRRLRQFTVQELIGSVELIYPASAKACECYLYALVRGGIVRKAGHAGRRPHQTAGCGPAIYRLPDDADPGPLPVLWKSQPDIYLDRNSGRIFAAAKPRPVPPSRANRRRIDSPTPHQPGA